MRSIGTPTRHAAIVSVTRSVHTSSTCPSCRLCFLGCCTSSTHSTRPDSSFEPQSARSTMHHAAILSHQAVYRTACKLMWVSTLASDASGTVTQKLVPQLLLGNCLRKVVENDRVPLALQDGLDLHTLLKKAARLSSHLLSLIAGYLVNDDLLGAKPCKTQFTYQDFYSSHLSRTRGQGKTEK